MDIKYLTIQDVTDAAENNAERYIDRAKKIAKQAFIEGATWALSHKGNTAIQEENV